MKAPLAKILSVGLTVGMAAVLALGTFDAAFARKKHRAKRPPAPVITRDYDGTPIIMKGFRRPPPPKEDDQPAQRVERPRKGPRGSGTYIPPPDPSPYVTRPTTVLPAPPTQVYTPPPINTYSDRVTNCIHSFPLNRGLGNNPTDQQSYIRQCAN
jgi:hypothetical protein